MELEGKINGQDILNLGIPKGPLIKDFLNKAQLLEARGVSKENILRELGKIEIKVKELPSLRQSPLKVERAIKTESLEEEENLSLSIQKMQELSLCPVVEACSLMPDTCPSGSDFGSIPVGGAVSTSNHIIPAAHSSDLCCSMMATFFDSKSSTKTILDAMEASTHFGPSGRAEGSTLWDPILEENVWDNPFLKGLEQNAHKHLATQGDGNHFFYLGSIRNLQNLSRILDSNGHYGLAKELRDSKLDESLVLLTHHGSRNLGAQIYRRGLEAAVKETEKIAKNIPKNLTWLDLETNIGSQYWEAIQYAQRWTVANHKQIHNTTLEKIQCQKIGTASNAHNFVWKHKNKILHGKGATPAWKDNSGIPCLGIIPLNMSSEVLITLGADNLQFLSFCPHGAGRNRSRTKTIEKYLDHKSKTLDKDRMEKEFKASTKELDIRWASKKMDISESPIGYKNKQAIKEQINEFELANIISEIIPKGCIMAGEFEKPWNIKRAKKALEKSKKAAIATQNLEI